MLTQTYNQPKYIIVDYHSGQTYITIFTNGAELKQIDNFSCYRETGDPLNQSWTCYEDAIIKEASQ